VVVSATLLFGATVLAVVGTFSFVLSQPNTYIIIFFLLSAIEIAVYALVLHAMSPIWQERRRRKNNNDDLVILEDDEASKRCLTRVCGVF
jgi:hypothetical protein